MILFLNKVRNSPAHAQFPQIVLPWRVQSNNTAWLPLDGLVWGEDQACQSEPMFPGLHRYQSLEHYNHRAPSVQLSLHPSSFVWSLLCTCIRITGDNSFDDAADFIKQKFIEVSQDLERMVQRTLGRNGREGAKIYRMLVFGMKTLSYTYCWGFTPRFPPCLFIRHRFFVIWRVPLIRRMWKRYSRHVSSSFWRSEPRTSFLATPNFKEPGRGVILVQGILEKKVEVEMRRKKKTECNLSHFRIIWKARVCAKWKLGGSWLKRIKSTIKKNLWANEVVRTVRVPDARPLNFSFFLFYFVFFFFYFYSVRSGVPPARPTGFQISITRTIK